LRTHPPSKKNKKPAKREKFLIGIERFFPWKELYALMEPFYAKRQGKESTIRKREGGGSIYSS